VNYATLYKLYQTLELPLIAVLVTMERNGVELGANALGKQQLDVIAHWLMVRLSGFSFLILTLNLLLKTKFAEFVSVILN
jgi:hypothetical protein